MSRDRLLKMKKRSQSATKTQKQEYVANNHSNVNRRLINYRKDIEDMKIQVSKLQDQMAKSDDSTTDTTNDSLQAILDKFSSPKYKKKNTENMSSSKRNESPNDLQRKYRKAISEIKELKNSLASSDNQYRRLSNQYKKLKQQNHELKESKQPAPEDYSQLESDNRVLAHKMKQLLNEAGKIQLENKQLREQITPIKEQNQELQKQLIGSQTRVTKYQNKIQDLTIEIQELKKNYSLRGSPNSNLNDSRNFTQNKKSNQSRKTNDNTKLNDSQKFPQNQKSHESDLKSPVFINTDDIKKRINENYYSDSKAIEALLKENEELKQTIIKSHSVIKENKKLVAKVQELNIEVEKLRFIHSNHNSLQKTNKPTNQNNSKQMNKQSKQNENENDTQINSLNAKIDALTKENNTLKKSIRLSSTNKDSSSSRNQRMASDSEAIASLTEKIADLTQEVMVLKAEAITNQTVNIENEGLKKKLEQKDNKAKPRPQDSETIASLTEKIADLTQELMTLKAEAITNQTVNIENEDLKKKLEQKDNKAKPRPQDSETIASLTEKVADLTQELMMLKVEAITNQTVNIENEDLKRKLKQREINSHKEKPRPQDSEAIADLTDRISSLAQENMELKTAVITTSSYADENEELKGQLKKLQKKSDIVVSDSETIASLTEKIAALVQENNELKAASIAHKATVRENKKLKEKLYKLVEIIEKTKDDQDHSLVIEALKDRIKTLSRENSELKSSTLSLESEGTRNSSLFNGSTINNDSALNETIKQMEIEFDGQKEEMKKHYDSLIKDLTEDINKPNPNSKSLLETIKSLEQQLAEQKKRYQTLYHLHQKLQVQLNKSRQNNQALITELDHTKKTHTAEVITKLKKENGELKEIIDSFRNDTNSVISEKELELNQSDELSGIKEIFTKIKQSIGDISDSKSEEKNDSNNFQPKYSNLQRNTNVNRKESKKKQDNKEDDSFDDYSFDVNKIIEDFASSSDL